MNGGMIGKSMGGMMTSEPNVGYGSFIPLGSFPGYQAGTFVPLELTDAKIPAPAFVASAPKLTDEEFMRPEETVRKFIGSY